MSIFEVHSGGDRQSLIKRFMNKSKQDAISQLVDIHLSNCSRAERLEAENEALRKDAERYRWLRRTEHWDNHYDDQKGEWIVESYEEVRNRTGEQLDGSIDAAIAKEKSQ